MLNKGLILASSSPRRRELLNSAGIPFEVQSADVPEEHISGESPKDFAMRLARDKARAISSHSSDKFVLGGDTIVVIENEILGKPINADDAERMLKKLSGDQHEVLTAVCLITPEGKEICETETTLVFMSPLSSEDISAYIAHGEPMDKAGAYAIQGIALKWIYRIEGDYGNVVGLPVARVWRMLQAAGYR